MGSSVQADSFSHVWVVRNEKRRFFGSHLWSEILFPQLCLFADYFNYVGSRSSKTTRFSANARTHCRPRQSICHEDQRYVEEVPGEIAVTGPKESPNIQYVNE
jgi:hypothetical protein